MDRKLIRWGALALVALMPLHAFFSVSLGHWFGHQAIWQSWKEAVILIMGLAGLSILIKDPAARGELKKPVNIAILVFLLISLVVTLLNRPPVVSAIFGLKTDLEFLVAFLLVQLAATREFRHKLVKFLLVSSGVVIAFGLLQVYLLKPDFLTQFGYGPSTVAPYQSVDPAIGSIRIISTLGGANQLGSFLILPLALVFWRLLRKPKLWQVGYLAAGLIVEWHTYSRSAWIGMALAFAIMAVAALKRSWRVPALLIVVVTAAIAVQWLVTSAGTNNKLQYYLFHQNVSADTGYKGSTDLHSIAFNTGLKEAREHPIGEGLGTAGPASFHNGRSLIPESYYLQLAIETGLAGLIAYLASQVLLALNMIKRGTKCSVGAPLMAALLGVGVVNLFLHGWADSSTALTFWTLAGAAVGEKS